MSEQTPNLPQQQEAFIPPYYMLILAAVGIVIAVIVALTQPVFNVVGWGALGLAALALVAWVLMAPDQARAVITGRTARYGGTTIIVTVIFLAALVAIYVLVRSQNWRVDLTESDSFSLTTESRQAVSGLAVEPNIPQVKLIAFYDSSMAGRQDQDTLLFEDYAKTSSGKISYEFVDPVRNPQQVELYKISRPGQIAVVPLKADGQPDTENNELVNSATQTDLTNAVLRVAAQGDFRAYFVKVEGGPGLTDSSASGLSLVNESLTQSLDWKTQEISLVELTSPQSEITLNDPAADGEVMVFTGGSKPLSDQELQIVKDFVAKGGDLVIFAAPDVSATATDSGEQTISTNQPLALAPNMSDFLYENFGLRFSTDLVVDSVNAFQSPLNPVAADFSTTSFITSAFSTGSAMLFTLPHRIEIAPVLPQNVTVDELAYSSDQSYAKTDLAAILSDNNIQQEEIQPADTDPKGPFVLAAAAENTATGARVALFGSDSIPSNNFALFGSSGVVNLNAAINSLAWVTNFDAFFSKINIQSEIKPQDAPILTADQELRTINLITVFLLPFGVLAIGLLVWWNNRERARQGER